MNSKIIGAIILAAACIGSAFFFARSAPEETKVALSAEQASASESGGCPIGVSGQCLANGSTQPSVDVLNANSLPTTSKNAYDFTLEKLGGGTITLAQYRGQKPVIVDFWTSWCPNCRRDMPKVNRWYGQYRDRVEVIGINLQEQLDVVQRFIQANNISFPIALDTTGSISSQFGIQFTNTHFLFNKAGELVHVIPGDLKESDVLSLLES